MTAPADQKNNGIQVISRAADILRTLGEDTGGLSLGQIARKVELPRSTVQRIVGALMDEGFVSADSGAGGIRLGPGLQRLAKASVRDTKDSLRAIMQQIAKETHETVDLAVMDGPMMLFVDQIVGSQRLRTVSSIGDRFPMTTTANGKAALACLDEERAAQLAIAEMKQMGRSDRTLASILSEVDAIRGGALATDEDEHTDGISALGFAVKDGNSDVFAISIPVPSTRYARLREQLSDVLAAKRQTLLDRVDL